MRIFFIKRIVWLLVVSISGSSLFGDANFRIKEFTLLFFVFSIPLITLLCSAITLLKRQFKTGKRGKLRVVLLTLIGAVFSLAFEAIGAAHFFQIYFASLFVLNLLVLSLVLQRKPFPSKRFLRTV